MPSNEIKTLTQTPAPVSEAARVDDILRRLSHEDAKLGALLLKAAVAGAVVARQPSDTMLRAEAAEAWNSMSQVIAHHLASEEEVIIPWAKLREDFPRDLIVRAREQHCRLRCLTDTIDRTSFITGSDTDVAVAGGALTALAVFLDDVIDSEERDLFPMLQRSLFAEGSVAPHA